MPVRPDNALPALLLLLAALVLGGCNSTPAQIGGEPAAAAPPATATEALATAPAAETSNPAPASRAAPTGTAETAANREAEPPPATAASYQRQQAVAVTTVRRAAVAAGKPEPAATPAGVSLTGSILLQDGSGPPRPAADVIVRLIPANPNLLPVSGGTSHAIDMQDKQYQPGMLSIAVNDQLHFPNRDRIKHNVFSSSGANRFDLGTYGPGSSETVTMTAPGIVKIYCNIHPEMAAFVAVGNPQLTTITGPDGRFVIGGLPAGDYTLQLWHIRGEMQQSLAIGNSPASVSLTLDTSDYQPTMHLNKFGKPYPKKPVLFEDEFY